MLIEKFKISNLMRMASAIQLIGMLIRDFSIINDEFWPMLVGVIL